MGHRRQKRAVSELIAGQLVGDNHPRRRHLISAPEWRTEMTNRFAVWNQIISAAAA